MRKLFTFLGVLILVSVLAAGAVSAQSNRSENFVAPLNTTEEVPEPDNFERNPRGLAKFHLSHDGNELHYKLIVANIEDVLMAHIHVGKCGETGPVVVWLHSHETRAPELLPGRVNGPIAEGVITADDLVGPLAGSRWTHCSTNFGMGMHTSTFIPSSTQEAR
jgi:hypothetical protein